MTIFSPDGKYGYVCSSFSPETVIIATAGHKIMLITRGTKRVGAARPNSPPCTKRIFVIAITSRVQLRRYSRTRRL
jgi:hypothetical protein